MKRLGAFLVLMLFLTSCSQQIADFVRGVPGRIVGDDILPSTSTNHPIGTKISPGANIATGTQVSSRFAITPTERTAQGTYVKARFSFHQNRPK